jgi:hypothetical protein
MKKVYKNALIVVSAVVLLYVIVKVYPMGEGFQSSAPWKTAAEIKTMMSKTDEAIKRAESEKAQIPNIMKQSIDVLQKRIHGLNIDETKGLLNDAGKKKRAGYQQNLDTIKGMLGEAR